MKNFTEIIAEAMKDGKTLEQVAQEMTAALNKVEQEQKQEDPRAKYLDKLDAETKEAFAEGLIDAKTAIKILTLCVAAGHPHWNIETLKTFQKEMKDCYETTVTLLDGKVKGKSLTETVGSLLMEAISEAVGELAQECECNKEAKTKEDTDSAKLAHFLRELGL